MSPPPADPTRGTRHEDACRRPRAALADHGLRARHHRTRKLAACHSHVVPLPRRGHHHHDLALFPEEPERRAHRQGDGGGRYARAALSRGDGEGGTRKSGPPSAARRSTRSPCAISVRTAWTRSWSTTMQPGMTTPPSSSGPPGSSSIGEDSEEGISSPYFPHAISVSTSTFPFWANSAQLGWNQFSAEIGFAVRRQPQRHRFRDDAAKAFQQNVLVLTAPCWPPGPVRGIRFADGVSYAALVRHTERWTNRPTSAGRPASTASAGADAPMQRASCTSNERGCWPRLTEYDLRCLSAGAFNA